MFAPHARQFAGDEFERLLPVDGHKWLAAAALAARPPALQPTRSYHRASDAKRRMHRIQDRLDQRRGVGVEVERDGADHLAVLYDGVECAPMGVVWNKLAIHRLSWMPQRSLALATDKRRPNTLGVPNLFHLGACLGLIHFEHIPAISVKESRDPIVGDAVDVHWHFRHS
jgi:hypothetical protein